MHGSGGLTLKVSPDNIVEARRHSAWKILRTIPGLGPIRVAVVIAIISTPHRFQSKRQLWKYCGLSVVTESSSDYYFLQQMLKRSAKRPLARGLIREFNHLLKAVIKSAASDAIRKEPFKTFYQLRISAGVPAEMARLIVARKIATLILVLWKRGVVFDANCLLKKRRKAADQTIPAKRYQDFRSGIRHADSPPYG